MIFQLQDLNRTSIPNLPPPCRGCSWWQGYDDGWPSLAQAGNWAEAAEDCLGGWGKLALGDEQTLGMIQYGPANLFPRAGHLACGPLRDRSVLLTCSLIADETFESVRKSLVLAVLGELKELEIEAVEAFSKQGSQPEPDCRLFDEKFLKSCGFYAVRAVRGIQLMRFELGGAEPVRAEPEPRRVRQRILERIKNPAPKPVPAALGCVRAAGKKRIPTCS